jgi:transposase
MRSAREVLLALALLFCDKSPGGRGGKTNRQVSREPGLSERTVEKLKKRFAEGGMDLALPRGPQSRKPIAKKFGQAFEAELLALASPPPPAGKARWTIRLLAAKLSESGTTPQGVSAMTIQRLLKKAKLHLGQDLKARGKAENSESRR